MLVDGNVEPEQSLKRFDLKLEDEVHPSLLTFEQDVEGVLGEVDAAWLLDPYRDWVPPACFVRLQDDDERELKIPLREAVGTSEPWAVTITRSIARMMLRTPSASCSAFSHSVATWT